MKKLVVLLTFLFSVGIMGMHAQSATAASPQATPAKAQCTDAKCAKNGQCSHGKTASTNAKYECKMCNYTSDKPGKCACGATLTKVAATTDEKAKSSK